MRNNPHGDEVAFAIAKGSDMTSAYNMTDDERREFATVIQQQQAPPTFGAESEGCWIDNAWGIYMGDRIIAIAVDNGFKPDDADGAIEACNKFSDYEHYDELIDEAEEFMNGLAAEGFWFGYSDGFGDWGLWAIEEEG